MHATISFTGKWGPLTKMLSPTGSGKAFKLHVGRATELNARDAARSMRETIRTGMSPKNAPLTIAIKKSSKPLVDDGDLFGSITGVKEEWHQGFAGLKRMSIRGKDTFNAAMILHEGASVRVTSAMRGMFMALARVAAGKMNPSKLHGRARDLYERNNRVKWKPLRPGTTHIAIPARPFVRKTVEEPMLIQRVKKRWEDAVRAALKV